MLVTLLEVAGVAPSSPIVAVQVSLGPLPFWTLTEPEIVETVDCAFAALGARAQRAAHAASETKPFINLLLFVVLPVVADVPEFCLRNEDDRTESTLMSILVMVNVACGFPGRNFGSRKKS
tara:strand:- start:33 stop:395 length:363 start_codon:yes stop_codon:yes gene_type:complete